MTQPHVALVTSGLGNALGGIGVVAESMHAALGRFADVELWRHDLTRERRVRLLNLTLRSLPRRRRRPDLLLYDHVGLSALSVLLPWLWGIPYGVFVHGTEVWRPLPSLARRALQNASGVFANSSFTVRQARQHNPWFPAAEVTWLGVSKPTLPLVAPRKRRALLVGRMDAGERQKGHDVVLDAWEAISLAVPTAELDVIGDGSDFERLRRRATALAGVNFLGRIPDAERNAAYAASSLFLFPSVQEGFGLAAVEAAAHGCPLLVVRGTVYDELFPEGSGATFVDAARPDDVAVAASRLLADASLIEDQSKRAQARVATAFLASHFQDRFCEAVERVLMARTRGPSRSS